MQGHSLRSLMEPPKFNHDNFDQPDFYGCFTDQQESLKKTIAKKEKIINQMAQKIKKLQNELRSFQMGESEIVGSQFLRQKLQDQILRNTFSRNFLDDIRRQLRKITTRMQQNLIKMKKAMTKGSSKSPSNKSKECSVNGKSSLRKSWDSHKVVQCFAVFEQKLQVEILNYLDIISDYTNKTQRKIFDDYEAVTNGGSKQLNISSMKFIQRPFRDKREIRTVQRGWQANLDTKDFKMSQSYKQLGDSYKANALQIEKLKKIHQKDVQKIRIIEDLLKQSQKQKNCLLQKISNSITSKQVMELQAKQKKDIIKTLVFQKIKIKELQKQTKILLKNHENDTQTTLERYNQLLRSFKDLKKQKICKYQKRSKSPIKF